MSDEVEQVEQDDPAAVVFAAQVMRQLMQSERFRRFLSINYIIQQHVDDEAKTINIVVIENPPEIAQQLLAEMATKHAKDHMPSVMPASSADMRKLVGKK